MLKQMARIVTTALCSADYMRTCIYQRYSDNHLKKGDGQKKRPYVSINGTHDRASVTI